MRLHVQPTELLSSRLANHGLPFDGRPPPLGGRPRRRDHTRPELPRGLLRRRRELRRLPRGLLREELGVDVLQRLQRGQVHLRRRRRHRGPRREVGLPRLPRRRLRGRRRRDRLRALPRGLVPRRRRGRAGRGGHVEDGARRARRLLRLPRGHVPDRGGVLGLPRLPRGPLRRRRRERRGPRRARRLRHLPRGHLFGVHEAFHPPPDPRCQVSRLCCTEQVPTKRPRRPTTACPAPAAPI